MNVGNYVNRKTGNVVKVVEVDEKTKTLIYEGADGKTHSVSWSSFRKSYKTAEENPEPEVKSNENKTEEKSEQNKQADEQSALKSEEESKKKKKERKERVKKEKLLVADEIEKLLIKYNVLHKIVGKRIYLLTQDTKKYGVLSALTNQARIYLVEDAELYHKTEKILEYVKNNNKSSKYVHTAVIAFDELDTIIKEAK